MIPLPWKKNHRWKINPCGFTLIEVLVSISILAIGILAVGSMQVMSIRGNAHANQVTEASVLARDRLERLMALAYLKPPAATDSALAAGTYHDSDPPEGYALSWTITDGGSGGVTPQFTKLIVVTVAHDNLNKDIALMDIKPRKP